MQWRIYYHRMWFNYQLLAQFALYNLQIFPPRVIYTKTFALLITSANVLALYCASKQVHILWSGVSC